MKNHCQVPPVPPCLLRRSFQLPPNTIFTCQDIREIQREKTIAYAHALQYCVEKSDLPTGGQPHQLAKSVKELWEKMSCYLSFLDKEVFKGITPLEGMPTTLVKEAEPHSIMAIPTATSKEQAAKEASQKPAKKRRCPKFPGWEKVLHPSQPVVVAGQPPHPLRSLEQTYLLMADCGLPAKIAPMKTPSPPQELEVAHQWTPTPSFLEVTSCLRDPLHLRRFLIPPPSQWQWE